MWSYVSKIHMNTVRLFQEYTWPQKNQRVGTWSSVIKEGKHLWALSLGGTDYSLIVSYLTHLGRGILFVYSYFWNERNLLVGTVTLCQNLIWTIINYICYIGCEQKLNHIKIAFHQFKVVLLFLNILLISNPLRSHNKYLHEETNNYLLLDKLYNQRYLYFPMCK
jgi:hypothetical protein